MKFAFDNSWLKWTLLGALALSSESGAGQTAVLLRAASVSRDNILLSDLLSPDASAAVRRASEQIELGRTPQCHKIRVFDLSDIEKAISSSPVLRGLAPSASVSVQRTCFPIRQEAVQRVISEWVQQKDINLVDGRLRWSAAIYASKENPSLEIEQALPDPVRPGLQVRLRCVERAICPSFWATVSTTRPPRFLPSAAPAAGIAQGPNLVRAGQRVMLIFDDPPLRMQLLVTCLQRGSLGAQVRAIDPSTHRVFQAEVTGAGTLTAHL